jgi:DNA-binding transcriptional MerR regulator
MHPALRTADAHAGTDLLLTGDVARLLDVSAETVRFWHRIGRLSALQTERGVRLFHRCDVERLAREREARHTTPTSAIPVSVG